MDNITASVLQDLPYSISAKIVRLYPNATKPPLQTCAKLELHGCVPQRKQGIYNILSIEIIYVH